MTEPKRHHFVPEMLLKRFTDDDGWLYHYTRRAPSRGVVRQKAHTVFVQNQRYSQTDEEGRKDNATERYLAQLERRADLVVAKILQAAVKSEVPNLTSDERSVWDEFFLTQTIRGPDVDRAWNTDQEADVAMAEIRRRLLIKYPERASEIAQLEEPKEHARLKANAKALALQKPLPKASALLRGRGIWIVKNLTCVPFIVGSRPVIQQDVGFRPWFGERTTENWLAVSSFVAVGIGQPAIREKLHRERDGNLVTQYNLLVASQSDEFASCDETLSRKLSKLS